ncbi:adhesion G protein-coupled receptor G3-like isoform X1 [Alosa pseudoharengus]|uniref:adhesion G protein-coupled receptor G3-like isoform X1 n=1 Tax=Alosa pseudoharengus TaxID=34774 RepID=UPI003F88954F
MTAQLGYTWGFLWTTIAMSFAVLTCSFVKETVACSKIVVINELTGPENSTQCQGKGNCASGLENCTSGLEKLWILNLYPNKDPVYKCKDIPFKVKKDNDYHIIFNRTLRNISLWIMKNWTCKPSSKGCNSTTPDYGCESVINSSVCGTWSKYDSDRCGDLQADFMLNTSMNKADNSSCVTCRNPVQVPVGNVKVNQTELFHNGQVNAAKANTLMENLKSTLDKLGNMSSAKVEAGEVKGAIIRLKEDNPFSVAYSVEAKAMVIVSNPNALQTKHSWSVDIPAEAVNISRSANGGEGFAGVLRFPNMSMDCKNSSVLDNAVYGISMSANISNLKDPIKIHFENVSMENVTFICTSWNGVGDQPTWTEDGCETVKGNSTITCKCYHLTFFAILMNALPTNDTLSESDLVSLTYISYIGCGLSIFFLGVALFMHFLLRKAKSSQAIQILMNLFTALLLLNLTFLTNESVANMGSNIGCIIIATLMHYSMLSTFTWFAMQALHLYLRLVKMSNTKDIKNYMLKMCIPAWACPAVVVITLAVLNKYTLVTITTTSGFQSKTCWIKDTTVHFVVNIGYYALVFLFTLGIFFVVVQKILMSSKLKVKYAKTPSVSKNLMAIMSLLALLGLTWGVAFFSYGPMMIPSYYIFCVLNAFQGFFLFIYYYNNSKDLAEDTKPDNTFSSSTSSNIATSNTYVTQG